MKKNSLIALLVSVIVFGGIATISFSQMVGNSTCLVMPGERVKEKFYVDYHGERVYLCCRNCVIKFKRNPEKYMKHLENR